MSAMRMLLATMGKSPANNFKALAAPSTVGVVPSYAQRRPFAADGRGNIIILGANIEDSLAAFSTNNGVSFAAVEIPDTPRCVKFANGLFHILAHETFLRYSTVTPGSTVVNFIGSLGSGGLYGLAWDDIVWDGTNYTLFGSSNIGANRLHCLYGPTISAAGLTGVSSVVDGTRIIEAVAAPGGGFIVARNGTALHRIVNGAITHTFTGMSGSFPASPGGSLLFTRGDRIYCLTTSHVLYSTDGIAWTQAAYSVTPAPTGSFIAYLPLGNYDFINRGTSWYRAPAGGTEFVGIGAQSNPGVVERAIGAHPFIYFMGGVPALIEAIQG